MSISEPSPNPVYTALAEIQRDPLIVVKERRNTALNSDYANLADVWKLLRPHLTKHGLAVSFQFGGIRPENSQWLAGMTLVVVHAASGTAVSTSGEFPVPEGNRGVNFAQRFGSAKTYAERYALTGFFGVITGDDDDAATAAEPPRAPEPGTAAPAARWQNFAEGAWRDAPAPGPGNHLCGELEGHERKQLCMAYPEHPALCASIAEGMESLIAKRGHTWETAVQAVKWDGPPLMEMTPNELHDCAAVMRGLPESAAAGADF